MSQRKSNKSLSVQDACPNDVLNVCVRFILCREGSKIPIKRSDIEKHLNNVCNRPYDKKIVIAEAQKVLKNVYGYRLIEKNAQYIVVLKDTCESLQSTYTDPNHRRLLTAALTHIFMTGGVVKEHNMWKFLQQAQLLDQDDYAGRKILTDTFKKQLYLEYTRIEGKEQENGEFKWGQRAEAEVPKMFILKKMSEATGNDPNYWSEQYKIATQENTSNSE